MGNCSISSTKEGLSVNITKNVKKWEDLGSNEMDLFKPHPGTITSGEDSDNFYDELAATTVKQRTIGTSVLSTRQSGSCHKNSSPNKPSMPLMKKRKLENTSMTPTESEDDTTVVVEHIQTHHDQQALESIEIIQLKDSFRQFRNPSDPPERPSSKKIFKKYFCKLKNERITADPGNFKEGPISPLTPKTSKSPNNSGNLLLLQSGQEEDAKEFLERVRDCVKSFLHERKTDANVNVSIGGDSIKEIQAMEVLRKFLEAMNINKSLDENENPDQIFFSFQKDEFLNYDNNHVKGKEENQEICIENKIAVEEKPNAQTLLERNMKNMDNLLKRLNISSKPKNDVENNKKNDEIQSVSFKADSDKQISSPCGPQKINEICPERKLDLPQSENNRVLNTPLREGYLDAGIPVSSAVFATPPRLNSKERYMKQIEDELEYLRKKEREIKEASNNEIVDGSKNDSNAVVKFSDSREIASGRMLENRFPLSLDQSLSQNLSSYMLKDTTQNKENFKNEFPMKSGIPSSSPNSLKLEKNSGKNMTLNERGMSLGRKSLNSPSPFGDENHQHRKEREIKFSLGRNSEVNDSNILTPFLECSKTEKLPRNLSVERNNANAQVYKDYSVNNYLKESNQSVDYQKQLASPIKEYNDYQKENYLKETSSSRESILMFIAPHQDINQKEEKNSQRVLESTPLKKSNNVPKEIAGETSMSSNKIENRIPFSCSCDRNSVDLMLFEQMQKTKLAIAEGSKTVDEGFMNRQVERLTKGIDLLRHSKNDCKVHNIGELEKAIQNLTPEKNQRAIEHSSSTETESKKIFEEKNRVSDLINKRLSRIEQVVSSVSDKSESDRSNSSFSKFGVPKPGENKGHQNQGYEDGAKKVYNSPSLMSSISLNEMTNYYEGGDPFDEIVKAQANIKKTISSIGDNFSKLTLNPTAEGENSFYLSSDSSDISRAGGDLGKKKTQVSPKDLSRKLSEFQENFRNLLRTTVLNQN